MTGKLKITPNHDRCFACGKRNPRGLQMSFHSENGLTCGHCRIRKGLESFNGVTHGGILTTILDAAMSRWLFDRGVSALTALMTVRFRKPVPPGSKLYVEARQKSKRGRRCHMVSRLLDEEKSVVASAEAIFIINPSSSES